ncbi:putative oxidoreductase [Pseudonocardia sediminis]|uniref:Putative oxidoreductase n=1 Tax=Pseudonocardia sediminis TaxID=1397368 RepID=A0A4Q7V3A0_PSEST|nr:DoxX family protein [Pseudonocardia sediminis]RZT87143.1 putative oxidoreductase [Pseudonocardia sediminis]
MRSLRSPLSDIALVIARVVLGVVLIAHGVQKLGRGVGPVAEGFAGMGIPLPGVAAVFTMAVELLGGVALIVGAFTPVAALLVVATMIGAGVFAHLGQGIFVDEGGWELVGVIAIGALALAASGAGRFSVDHVIATRRDGTTTDRTPVSAGSHRA